GGRKPPTGNRKAFIHALGAVLLAKLKSANGEQLKRVLDVVEKALWAKELEIYFTDPRGELALRPLGLFAEISRGGEDGFFAVDTNIGGNKANTYVREDYTDFVTLLPDGGALHHLRIVATYDKSGPAYDGDEQQKDYVALQRTYLPGDA